MGQKTHPYAFRIGIVNDWKSRWFSDKDYTKLVNQDYRIREFLSSQLIKGAVSRIDIERTRDKVQVDIHTARPGVVIGRKGAEADRLRKGLEKLSSQPVKLNIIEVREPELDAQLLARAVADQHRVNFIENQRENFSVREVMPLSGPVLVEFINGVLNNNTEKD